MRKPLVLSTALVTTGGIIAFLWVRLTGEAQIAAQLADLQPLFLVPLLAITAFFFFARFVRWHYLLRRAGVWVPTRPSLGVYLASIAGTATPAYVGELVRSVFMRRRFGVPLRVTTWVLIVERLLDVLAVAVIGFLVAPTWINRGIMGAFLAAAALVLLVGSRYALRLGVPDSVVAPMRSWRVLLPAIALSLAAWTPAAFLFTLASGGIKFALPPVVGMSIFSNATLLGSLTLMPAGVGSVGSVAILQLQEFGLPLAGSVVTVTLVRMATTGIALVVGSVFLVNEWLSLRQAPPSEAALHFDDIAVEYLDQFSPHVWQYLLKRRLDLVEAHLQELPRQSGVGLDLGCGLGFQSLEMRRRGYHVVGIDLAHGLLRKASQSGAPVVNGDALSLPFASESLDFVYTIGVLHHLPAGAALRDTLLEVARVLKPGGRLIVHETNPRNPLFRFYMGYIFPILKRIDEGTERWIEPLHWQRVTGLDPVGIHYYTFLPDFIPQAVLPLIVEFERKMETGRFQSFSVHYMAVLQKSPDLAPRGEARSASRVPIESRLLGSTSG